MKFVDVLHVILARHLIPDSRQNCHVEDVPDETMDDVNSTYSGSGSGSNRDCSRSNTSIGLNTSIEELVNSMLSHPNFRNAVDSINSGQTNNRTIPSDSVKTVSSG